MITRRSITTAAWTAPVVALCVPVPAYAASAPSCTPTAECKRPGEGTNTKDYAVRTNCVSGGKVLGVRVFDDKDKAWRVGEYDDATGAWVVRGFNDSRRTRLVEITTEGGVVTRSVDFPPC